jgi:DNA-directed RNA polymerase specialized sigma24 family protein
LVGIMNELMRTRPQDAELIEHRLRGRKWREISAATGVSEEALRQRWSSLVGRLRSRRS